MKRSGVNGVPYYGTAEVVKGGATRRGLALLIGYVNQ